ncbi:MAG: hypothetical protein V6Z78_01385 [Holosporaceae bacterium]
MHHRFFIFCLSFLLAHTPLAFAPQDPNSRDERQDEDRQSPAPCANVDALNSDDTLRQSTACATKLPNSAALKTVLSSPIFRDVLVLLTIDDLKDCRLVCKEWYHAATYALSLKPGLRLKLPPLGTPSLPACTGVSCETTVVAVPEPIADAASPTKDVSEATALNDPNRVKLFLNTLYRDASSHAWQTPSNSLQLTFNDRSLPVFETLRPAAVTVTLLPDTRLPKPLPVQSFQHVHHLSLQNQQVPPTFFVLLAKAPLKTLDLSWVRIIRPSWESRFIYDGISQLRHLKNLTDLNLAHLKDEHDQPLGEIIWHATCEQAGLSSDADLVPTHLQELTNKNPISHLANLEKLDLSGAEFFLHLTFLKQCAPKLKVLHMKGNTLDHRHHAFLNTLPNLKELTPPALDWFFGEAKARGHNLSVALGQDIANHDNAAPFQIEPNLCVLNLSKSGIDNTYLKRLTALATIENLNVRKCYLQGRMPDDDNEDDLQTQGHVLLGQFPLKVLNASHNTTLCRVPAFTQAHLLTKLNLTRCGLRSFEGLNACVNLRILYAGANPVSVSETWCHMTQLRQLRVLNVLNDMGIHHYDAETRATFTQVLSQNTHLTSLNLMQHSIGPEGATALEHLHRLETLYLSHCGISDVGFSKLPLLNIENLDMRNNVLTASSVRHLWQVLDQISQPRLRGLSLESNLLGDDAIQYLARMTYLETLAIENIETTAEGMQKLAPLVPHLKSLICEDHLLPQTEEPQEDDS